MFEVAASPNLVLDDTVYTYIGTSHHTPSIHSVISLIKKLKIRAKEAEGL